jgi:phospholipid/cholesterol/gamma-HCH transport system substrate-binding protein
MSLATLGGNRVIALLAGSFVLLGAVVIAGWLYLQVVQPGHRAEYFVLLPDVSGLRPGTQVKVAGYPVGEIRSITPELENIDQVEFKVDFVIDKLWPIPVDSTVTVVSDDLLSGPTLVLYPGKTDTLLAEGARILTLEAPPSLTDRASRLLEDEVTPTLRAMTATLEEMQRQLKNHVPEILRETRSMVATTAEAVAVLRPQVDRLASGLGDAGTAMSRLADDGMAGRVDAILADLKRVAENLAGASRRLAQVVDSSGRLVADNRAPLSSTLADSEFTMQAVAASINLILRNLERTSQDLAGLIADIRANPSILVRGSGSDGRDPFR